MINYNDRRPLIVDMTRLETSGPVSDKLVHYDEYFVEENGESTLAIVLDHILDALPEMYADPVKLIYLENHTLREAGRSLNIDHKTVKARARKGVQMMREKLLDTEWIKELLRGYIPAELINETKLVSKKTMTDLLNGLTNEQE